MCDIFDATAPKSGSSDTNADPSPIPLNFNDLEEGGGG